MMTPEGVQLGAVNRDPEVDTGLLKEVEEATAG